MSIILAALAIVESGNKLHPNGDDHARGEDGEHSRYQIMPAVWQEYARKGERPTVKAHAERVTCAILFDRCKDYGTEIGFMKPEVIYALWHRPGQFTKRGYDLKRMPKIVQARCKRFATVCAELERKGVE